MSFGAPIWRFLAGTALRQVVVSFSAPIPSGSALVVPTEDDAWVVGSLRIRHAGPTLGVLTLSELAALRPAHRPTWLVPCVPVFAEARWARPRLLVLLGAPLRPLEQDPEVVAERTEELMESLELLPAPWDELIVLEQLRRLYTPRGVPAAERAERLAQFERSWHRVRGEPDIRELAGRIATFADRRLAMRLRETELGALERPAAFREMVRLLGLYLMLPFALIGAILHAPVSIAAGIAFSPERSAWRRLLASLVAPTGALVAIAAGASVGRLPGLGVAVGLLVVSGLAVARLHERAISIPRFIRALRQDLTPGRAARDLWVERLMLAEAAEITIDRVRESYLVLFPPGSMEMPMGKLPR